MENEKNIFEWYISLFFDHDNNVRIGAWSVTLSMITFIVSFIIKPSRVFLLSLLRGAKIDEINIKSFEDIYFKYSFIELKQHLKIIVVDDDDIFPVSGFAQFGYRIQKWDILDASKLKSLKEGDFDIIILDIWGIAKEIAENDGLDVLEDLKNNNPAQVIVAFSGHSFDLSKNKFWELADEKLSKPTPFIGTQKIIDNLIEKTFTIEYHISKLKKVLNDNNLSDQIAKLENLFVQFKEKNGEPDWIKELEFLSLKSGEKQKIASIFKKLFSFTSSYK